MEEITLESVIQSDMEQTIPKKRPRKKAQWLWFVADVAVAGILLCTFALFHHVLPPSAPVVPDTPSVDIGGDNSTLSPMEQTFDEHFQFAPITTENSYVSKNVMIEVSKHEIGKSGELITYYVADVYLRSVESFRTAFAKDTFGAKGDFLKTANNKQALFAVSGDYYTWNTGGPVIRNGVLYRNKQGRSDVCVLYKDGTMKTVPGRSFDAKKAVEEGAWQVWAFGPSLLTADGKAATSFNSTLTDKHPRCAIGYYAPGHYAFVLVDGRQKHSAGMTLAELAQLFESLGCSMAYNLDGGRSAQMAFGGKLTNQPYRDGREVSDIVYIGEVE